MVERIRRGFLHVVLQDRGVDKPEGWLAIGKVAGGKKVAIEDSRQARPAVELISGGEREAADGTLDFKARLLRVGIHVIVGNAEDHAAGSVRTRVKAQLGNVLEGDGAV